jgi:hypothetical protein
VVEGPDGHHSETIAASPVGIVVVWHKKGGWFSSPRYRYAHYPYTRLKWGSESYEQTLEIVESHATQTIHAITERYLVYEDRNCGGFKVWDFKSNTPVSLSLSCPEVISTFGESSTLFHCISSGNSLAEGIRSVGPVSYMFSLWFSHHRDAGSYSMGYNYMGEELTFLFNALSR